MGDLSICVTNPSSVCPSTWSLRSVSLLGRLMLVVFAYPGCQLFRGDVGGSEFWSVLMGERKENYAAGWIYIANHDDTGKFG